MRIIAFANQKGGVGKTTSTAACGHALAELGHRVLLIDLDPQSSLTVTLGLTPAALERTVYDLLRDDDASPPPSAVITKTAVENLDLIPSNIDLASAETELVGQLNREGVLRGVLASVEGYDFILIDCPPSLGLLTTNALTAATDVIIPISADYLAMRGASLLMKTITRIQKKVNPALVVRGILITMHDARTLHAKEVLEEIRSVFQERVFKAVIKQSVRAKEAPVRGQSILGYDPHSELAQAYRALAQELLTTMPPKDRANISGLGQEIFGEEARDGHPVDTISENENRLVPIPLERIRPNPDQPRQHFDEADLDDLAASIKQNGLLQPIVVEEDGDHFTILVGERRWRAAQKAGLSKIPALVRKRGGDRLVLAILENLQREDLNPIEEAEALQKLAARGWSNRQVADLVSKAESTISELLGLARLPEDIKTEVRTGVASVPRSTLIKIAASDTEEVMRDLWEQAKRGLTVREVRRLTQAKPKAGRPAHYVFHHHEPNGTYEVQIRFRKARVSPEEVIKALEAAIAQAEKKAA